ncbi:MAG TPA: hypothetical protein VJY65_04790 [Chloroflexota bacterium]|nr:hypothetical protein [Chloroflexota bacterium]
MGAPLFNLEVARQQAALSMSELWFAYLGLGGMAMPAELHAYVLGVAQPDCHEYNVLALNERFAEHGTGSPGPIPELMGVPPHLAVRPNPKALLLTMVHRC